MGTTTHRAFHSSTPLGRVAARRGAAALIATIVMGVWLGGCAHKADRPQPQLTTAARRPTIVFMSDFGTANDAVAICRAVMLGIAPEARIENVTHRVTPFHIEEGARFLAGVTPYYPAGTVFLTVVDPGVGTTRKAIIVKSKRGQYFVLPDNGLITPVAERDGIEGAREITNTNWMLTPTVSSTFHGRDIFSPAAAHLARGEDWTTAGPVVGELVRLEPRLPKRDEKGISGEVIGLDDPFGSLITNIPGDDFRKLGYALGDKVQVRVGKRDFSLPYVKTFMEVPIGQLLLYVDSRGRVGIACNQKDFAKAYKIISPAPVFIPRKGR